MRVPPRVVCAFPWGIPQLQSDWSLSCVTTDLIMRVYVRTTTTTTRAYGQVRVRFSDEGKVLKKEPPVKRLKALSALSPDIFLSRL